MLTIKWDQYAKLLQSCPTLCDHMESSPPGSSVHRILQAKVPEWGVIAFSDISSRTLFSLETISILITGTTIYLSLAMSYNCFQGGSVVKNPPANEGDTGAITGSGRSPGGGNSNPLQYSYLGNPMDRAAWLVAVHGGKRVRHDLTTTTVSCKHA